MAQSSTVASRSATEKKNLGQMFVYQCVRLFPPEWQYEIFVLLSIPPDTEL
jgi:hypothetical protein